MHALKKIGQSRADAKAADRYEELYSELQQRTDDYDAAIEAAAGRHCPSGEIWENFLWEVFSRTTVSKGTYQLSLASHLSRFRPLIQNFPSVTFVAQQMVFAVASPSRCTYS